MNTTELAPGLTVSRLINGLWQIADRERNGQQVDAKAAAAAMLPYVQAGLTTFDMADHYGSAEEIVGTFRKVYPQHPIQSLTKWVPEPGPVTRAAVKQAVDRACNRLHTACIDLMQFHAWNYADPSWLDALFYLAELKAQGQICHLGVTNFDTAHLHIALASGIPIATNQVCFSLLDSRAAGEMTALCHRYGVKLLTFGVLAGGFLSHRWLDKPEPELNESLTWSQMKYKRFIDAAGGWVLFQNMLGVLHRISERHSTSIANVAVRWMLDQPAVGAVLVGTRLSGSESIQDNLNALRVTLAESDRVEIRAACAQLTSIPGDCGDEYRKPPFLTASGDLSHHVSQFPKPYPVKRDVRGVDHALSGTVWEDLAGFSRAIRKGNRILISGTTATHGDRVIGGADPVAQMQFVLDKIEGALQSLGARLEDVVRTRIYVRHINDWELIARAHGQRFAHIQPANTMVRADLIGDEYLVEMEVEAEV